MRARAQAGESVDAERYVLLIPHASPEQIADLVYGEFVTNREQGRAVPAEHYLAKYPSASDELSRQFLIDETLSEINDEDSCSDHGDCPETVVAPPSTVVGRATFSGETIGRYIVVDRLKHGAQAEVYRAYDPILKRDVMIKIEAERKVDQPRVFSDLEAVISANLDHPNIAPALDAGDHDGRKYSVTRFIRGRTFDQWVRDCKPSPQLVAQTVAKVARGLAYAHNRAVLHLDVKPRNIIIDENHEPYLIDFGLSVTCDAYAEHAMEEGSIRGTLQFMAPEQVKGDVQQIGPRSDIFGLGATLFMGWVGSAPYDAPRDKHDLGAITRCEWHTEWLDDAGLSDEMRSVVVRSLAASPGDRFSHCDDFADALERVCQEPAAQPDRHQAANDLGSVKSSRTAKLWRRGALGVAAAMVAALGLAIWLPKVTDDEQAALAAALPTLDVVVVVENDRPVELANRVPLVSGDMLRLTGFIPAKQAGKIVVFAPDGACQVIAQFDPQDEGRTFQYPDDPGKAIPLVGPGGTEVIALITADSQESLNRVVAQIGPEPKPWPLIPERTVLAWSNDEFRYLQPTAVDHGLIDERLAGGSRKLGGAVEISPALAELSRQFESLTNSLSLEHVEIDAVAFRHLAGP